MKDIGSAFQQLIEAYKKRKPKDASPQVWLDPDEEDNYNKKSKSSWKEEAPLTSKSKYPLSRSSEKRTWDQTPWALRANMPGGFGGLSDKGGYVTQGLKDVDQHGTWEEEGTLQGMMHEQRDNSDDLDSRIMSVRDALNPRYKHQPGDLKNAIETYKFLRKFK